MTAVFGPERVVEWIDGELVQGVEQMEDPAAEFNLAVEMSGMLVHVIRRQPDGPLLVGQRIAYGESFRDRVRALGETRQHLLVTRVREALMGVPIVYGFQDDRSASVGIEDMTHIFVEARVYPDAAAQQSLMDALVAVWKAMRYLDDLPAVVEHIEG